MPGLIKLVTAGENRKTRGNGPVKERGLGEPEKEAARKVAELGGKGKRLAEAQEVVGLVGETDEAAREAVDAALQADGLLAFLLEFQADVDGAFLLIALDLRGLVRFDSVKVVELVKAEDADFPQALIEQLAFVNQQLTADHFVARGGVAGEIDAPDEILLLLVKFHRQVDDFLLFIDFRVRLGSEIDESVFTVNLAVILQVLADLFRREDVPLLERKSALQRVNLEGQGLVRIGADNLERTHVVAVALFDGDSDVDGLAVGATGDQRNAEAVPCGVDVIEDGLTDGHLEITVVAIQAANADFQILAQPFAIVGFR